MRPLAGLRIVEIAAIGPGPFCGMLLAGLGAEVILVERPGGESNGLPVPRAFDVPLRDRTCVTLDLKSPEGVEAALALAAGADGLFEGFRPGVAERLGIGPAACHARNKRLVYGRVTGWGQSGPLAQRAGHDINFIALTGALHAMGRAGDPPEPPLNLVGDYGGGALFLALGMVAGLLQAARSGEGCVVDAAMVDGVSAMMAMVAGLSAAGLWSERRGSNLLDGSAPFYRCYACQDGGFVAVGALEPKFFAILAAEAGLDAAGQYDRACWPGMRGKLAGYFAARPRDAHAARFAGLDACVTPVLSLAEAALHPHMAARVVWRLVDGVPHPAAAPRFEPA